MGRITMTLARTLQIPLSIPNNHNCSAGGSSNARACTDGIYSHRIDDRGCNYWHTRRYRNTGLPRLYRSSQSNRGITPCEHRQDSGIRGSHVNRTIPHCIQRELWLSRFGKHQRQLHSRCKYRRAGCYRYYVSYFGRQYYAWTNVTPDAEHHRRHHDLGVRPRRN